MTDKPLISVISPSFLGTYEGATSHPKEKFVRAVDSFLANKYPNKEIIIISDGCPHTIPILKNKYHSYIKAGVIRYLDLPRHELFTGSVRQQGIDSAKGRILCNLDLDDIILPYHLNNIAIAFNPDKYDWGYFNFYRALDELKNVEELCTATPDVENLCTANVVWKSGLDVTWNNCDGRQDNAAFNRQLIEKYPKKIKIYGCGYVVKHAQFKHVVAE